MCSDVGVRGMATSTEILLSNSKNQERVAEQVDKRPTTRSYHAEKATKAPQYAAKPRWYRPDPVTGAWLPETESEGQVTSSTESVIAPSLITRVRAESTDSTEDKGWWTSMEELPDMDRHLH